jgi:hypothetical protein
VNDQRLDKILTRLAQRHAPDLLRQLPADRLPALARRLASYNLLVLMGEVTQPVISPDTIMRVQTWADGYIRLYSLLAHPLFPSFTHISAQYADDKLPVVIVVKGAATPIMHVLAGFVSPFIAQRQRQATVSEMELLGLMDALLEELEATDLPREEYRTLRSDGAGVLKDMLRAPVRQLLLTPFDHPLFSDIPQPSPQRPDVVPEAQNLPARGELPESPVPQVESGRPSAALSQPAETRPDEEDEPLFETSIPIFFVRKPHDPKKPRPSLFSVPEEDSGES